MANSNIFKQGEAKTWPLEVVDADTGETADFSGAALSLGIKKLKTDGAYIIFKADADFDKSQAAIGKVSVFLTAEDTNQELPPGELSMLNGRMITLPPSENYIAELMITWPGSPATIEKTADIEFIIEGAVIR